LLVALGVAAMEGEVKQKGDAECGKAVFHSTATNCAACHFALARKKAECQTSGCPSLAGRQFVGDEVENYQEELPTFDAIRAIVEQRFTEYEKDPSTALSLEAFKHRFSLP